MPGTVLGAGKINENYSLCPPAIRETNTPTMLCSELVTVVVQERFSPSLRPGGNYSEERAFKDEWASG